MRKHFLILMLLTLLPFAGWAAAGDPTAKAGLVYDANEKELVNDGTADGKEYYYAKVANEADAPTSTAAYSTTLPKETNAGDWDVWFIVKNSSDALADADLETAVKLDVKIAKATLTIQLLPVGITYGDNTTGLNGYYDVTYPVAGQNTPEAVGLTITPSWPSDLSVGTRTYSVSASANTNYNIALVTTQANFTVSKKAILIKTKFTHPAHFYYGDNIPELGVEFEGLVGTDELTVDASKLSFTIQNANTDAIAETETERAWLAVGTWNITPAYTGTYANYEVTVNETTSKQELTVEKRAIAGITVQYEGISASNPYKGAAYAPTFKAFIGEGANKKEVPTASYTLKLYKTNTYTEENTDYRNKGDFWVKVTDSGVGNFDDATPYTKDAVWFKIVPVTLTVQVSDFTKIYDHTANLTVTQDMTNAGFKWLTFYTLKGTDKDANFAAVVPTTTKVDVKAGGYAEELTVTSAALENVLGNHDNYNYNIIPGKLTINPATLTFAAKTTSSKYTKKSDENDAFALEYEITGYVDDNTATQAAINTAIFTTDNAPSLVRTNTSNVPGQYPISWSQGTKKSTVVNYDIVYTDVPSTVFLTITPVEGAHVVVTIFPKSKTYDKTPTTFGTLVEGEDYIVSGKVPTDVLEGTLTLSYGDKEDADTYELVGSGFELSAEALLHYDTTTYPTGIEYVNGEYTINPVKISSLTINEQMLKVGEAVKQNSAEYTAYTAAGVLEDDNLGAVIAENVDNTDENAPSAANETGIFSKGLVVSAFTNPNYVIDVTGGKFYGRLIRYAGEAYVLDDSKDLTAAAELVAKNALGTPMPITFSSRNMNAEKWNALVLPFDVTMTELIQAFGQYVVVDVLKETSDGNAHFKINLEETIEANTPFLIMMKTAKNMNTVNFANKIIKYVTVGDNQTVRDEQGNPYVTNGSGVKFIGVYKQQSFTYETGAGIKYMSGGQFFTVGEGYTGADADHTLYQKPLRAYLDMSETLSAHPMIFIENPDGSTTAISAINADNLVNNYTKDGWFTINGMKLNDMPTEKGIYIHNGKKVVLK